MHLPLLRLPMEPEKRQQASQKLSVVQTVRLEHQGSGNPHNQQNPMKNMKNKTKTEPTVLASTVMASTVMEKN